MSINKLISIYNPIVDALDYVGADRSVDLPIFTTWATAAEKEIGSVYSFVRKRKVIDICGCTAEIPCDAFKIDAAIFGDHGCDCGDLFNGCFFPGGNWFANTSAQTGTFLIVDLDSSLSGSPGIINFQIQNNKIVLPSDMDGQKITIQYIGYQEDDKGFIMISENHTRAITEYILWKYGIRSAYSQKPINPSLIAEHKREWFRLCRHARADDAILTPGERELIAQAFNDPYKGRGFWVGMKSQWFDTF